MSEPFIVCPTHARAGRVITFKTLPDIPLCVAESQAASYAKAYPNAELIVHPDSVVGIAPKRQWILDNFGDAFMIDDDLTALVDVQVQAGEEARVRDPEMVKALIFRLHDMAEQMGIHVYGFSSYPNPTMYRPQNPFSFKQMVSGGALGIRRSDKIVFPPKSDMLNDDLYISALALHYDRVVLTDLRYAQAVADTWTGAGGMQEHRTMRKLIDDEKYMKMVFGEDVIRRRESSALSTIQNEVQLQLRVPW